MPQIIPVTTADDPRLAAYQSIRERDLVGRSDGRFIVEGKVTLGILLTHSRFQVESLFLGQSRVEPLSDLLETVPDNVPIYVAPQDVMDSIAGFAIHRGTLACARKGGGLSVDDILKDAPRTLLLADQISNHDNVGALFRNAAAFGAGGVVLDRQSCSPLYRKAIRVSAGTSLWLLFYHGGTSAEHIERLQSAGYEIWAMTPNETASPLNELRVPDKLALLVGAEGPGLPQALLQAAQPVRIPMAAGFDSVNVATAAAIALAHVFQNAPSPTHRI